MTKINFNKNIEACEQFCKFGFDLVPEIIKENLKLSGWVVGIESPVVGVELIQKDQLVEEVPLTFHHPLAAQIQETFLGTERCGFEFDLALDHINLEAGEILIQAVFENFQRILLASIHLSKTEASCQDGVQIQAELQETRKELEQLQSQFDEVLAELEEAHLSKTEASYQNGVQIQAELQETRKELEQLQSQFDEVLAELEEAHCQLHQTQTQQPDLSNEKLLLQLTQALFQQGQIEKVITIYYWLVELFPREEYYDELGKLLVKQEKWNEAISVYRQAIAFNQNSYLYYYQLGEVIYQRVMENPESFFVDYQIKELLDQKEYQVGDRELPELCFINDEQFLQATEHLDDEAYAVEVFRVYKRYDVPEWEKKACVHWLSLPETSRELGVKYWRSLPEFQVLLHKSIISVCLNEALLPYRQVLKLNPHHLESYKRVAEILTQQEKYNQACETYYQLAILLAEQGQLDQAITYFQKAPQHFGNSEKIYDAIWQGLNGLAPLDIENPYYPKEINAGEVLAHFERTAKDTVICLESLTENDKVLLEKEGLSLAHLELMRRDSLALEEIYINSFGESSPIELTQTEKRTLGLHYHNWSQGMHLQQSLVETGYMYTVCPFTGKVLRSNHCLVVDSFFNYYRFVGKEVFYYLVGDWFGSRLCLYLPNRGLIIPFYSYPHITFSLIINRLKTYLVTYWQQVKAYLSNHEPKELVTIQGFMPNLGHYIWNDLAGIFHIVENNLLHHLSKFIIGAYEFMNVDVVFPDIEPDKILRISDSWEVFRYIIENNYCGVRLVEMYIKEKLSKRLYQASLTKCSQEFLEKVEVSKQHSPLLLVTLRSKRAWNSQVEGLANILNLLYEDFPNLGVIFDGWSRTERDDPEAESVIAVEQDMMKQIIARLSGDIKTYSLIGATTYETLVWSDAIDFYITPMATSLTFVVWTAHKPGVTYGNQAFYGENVEYNYSYRTAENAIMPVFVPKEFIVDGHDPNPFSRSYECDWKAIYNEIYKLLKDWQNNSTISIESAGND